MGCQLFTVALLGTQANRVFVPALLPLVFEKRAPREVHAFPVMVMELRFPKPHVGTLGLVVNLEYSGLEALPDIGWPKTYMPTCGSVV
jgi:hypothetical protein